MYSFCGIKCEECEFYIATQSGDPQKLQEVANKYSNEDQKYEAGDIECYGCREKDKKIFSWCNDCEIRRCCMDNKNDCIQCAEFPCEIINNLPDAKIKERIRSLRAKK